MKNLIMVVFQSVCSLDKIEIVVHQYLEKTGYWSVQSIDEIENHELDEVPSCAIKYKVRYTPTCNKGGLLTLRIPLHNQGEIVESYIDDDECRFGI